MSESLEERPLVIESVDHRKAVVPNNEKFDDNSQIIAAHDTSDLESSSDCNESQRPCSLSQTVCTSFPIVSTSNSVHLSNTTHNNFGKSFPVVTSTQIDFQDSTATPVPNNLDSTATPDNGCHTEKCNVCGYRRIVDACDGKAGKTQTVRFHCKCLDRDEMVIKLNGLDVKTRREKVAKKRSRKRVHACGLCSRAFGTHSGLFGHLSRQHPAMSLSETRCGICERSFVSASEFLNHVIVFGGSNRNLKSSGRVDLTLFEGNAKVLGIDEIFTGNRGSRPRKNMLVVPESGSSSQVHLEFKTGSLELKMGSHKCPICLEVFWTHASLYRHTAQHEFLHVIGGCLPTCGICQTSFGDVSQLVEHVTSKAGQAALQKDDGTIASGALKELPSVAPTRQVFDCSYCDRSFASRSGLRSHVNMHLNGRPHKCPSCGNEFRFAKHLASHARMFHNISICSKCGVNCSCSEEELKASEADSGDPKSKAKVLTCQDCPKVFQSRKGYLNHRHVHDGAKSFVCEFCGRAFNRKDRLVSHRSTHVSKAFPCAFCEKRFLSPSRLQEHTRTHSGESPLACSHCGLCFRTSSTLRVHFVRKHSSLHGLKVVNFKCDVCARQFSSRTYLNMHLKWHSGRQRTIKCDICRRGFYDANGLRRHMAVHVESRERPFLCYTCNKGFTSRGNLQTHVLSHKKDHSFVCEDCNKGFKFKGRLKRHRKVDCRIDLCDMNAITRTDCDIGFACEEVVVDV